MGVGKNDRSCNIRARPPLAVKIKHLAPEWMTALRKIAGVHWRLGRTDHLDPERTLLVVR
jgi:hypothetical protein